MSTFIEFFEFLKKAKPDISKDIMAQDRWLSESFRRDMKKFDDAWSLKLKKHPDYKPENPNNGDFLGVWNAPTTYSIVSSREYDYRDQFNPKAFRTVIDVLYQWGQEKDLENQYPGVRNLHSFYFIFENGSWKLDDIYIFNDEFTSSESLRQYYRNLPSLN